MSWNHHSVRPLELCSPHSTVGNVTCKGVINPFSERVAEVMVLVG